MPNALKDVARFNTIISKVATYGFHHILTHAKINYSSRTKSTPTPKRLRELFEDLGGAFPKLGQLLSLRPDLIPQEYSEALEGLQDNMRPFSSEIAKETIERELKSSIKKIFRTFNDTPIAAASIGQVHKAELMDGTLVVVKVQRPNIREKIEEDIDILERLAKMVSRHGYSGPVEPERIIEEFKRYTEQELDYLTESRSLVHFAQTQAAKELIVPRVIEKYCTPRVLVMTYVQGKRITSIKSQAERKIAAKALLHMQLQSVFMDGFFHADPHPGNVLWHDGKIVLLDFGIIGQITESTKENLGRVFVSLLTKDIRELTEALKDLGFTTHDTNMEEFSIDLKTALGPYYDAPLGSVKLGTLLKQVLETSRKHNITVPRDYVLLTKAVVTLESTCATLDPEFKFPKEAHPFLKELAMKHANPAAMRDRFGSEARKWKRLLKSIPDKADKFFVLADQGERAVVRLDKDLTYLTKEIHVVSSRLVGGILAGAFVVAGALVVDVGPKTIGNIGLPAAICFAISIIFLAGILVSAAKERH